MNKSKLTRTLMAACSIVALSAVMYGCSSGGDTPETVVEQPDPDVEARALAAAQDAAMDAWHAARDSLAGVSGKQSANSAAYQRAVYAVDDAKAAYDAAMAAATSAEAKRHQAAAEAANTRAMNYADLVVASYEAPALERAQMAAKSAADAAKMAYDEAKDALAAVESIKGSDMASYEAAATQVAAAKSAYEEAVKASEAAAETEVLADAKASQGAAEDQLANATAANTGAMDYADMVKEKEDDALTAARTTAGNAYANAKEAYDAADARVAALEDKKADDVEGNYFRAKDALGPVKAAHDAAKEANDLAQVATTSADAATHQATVESRKAAVDNLKMGVDMYADLVENAYDAAQAVRDNIAAEVKVLADAKDAAMKAATAARTAATSAREQATKVSEALGPNSDSTTAANAAATAAEEAATAAEEASARAQEDTDSADAMAEQKTAEGKQSEAEMKLADATDLAREAGVATAGLDQLRIEFASEAAAKAKIAAAEQAEMARSKATLARKQATRARDAADKALRARTDHKAADTEATAAETAATAAETDATAAETAANMAESEYMKTLAADVTVAAARTARDEAREQRDIATAKNKGAESQRAMAETAAADAVAAAKIHVLELFKMANAYHIKTAPDPDANTDETEEELIAKFKGEHVEAVNKAISEERRNPASSIEANVTWPYSAPPTPKGKVKDGKLNVMVNSISTMRDDSDTKDEDETNFTSERGLGAFTHGFDIFDNDQDDGKGPRTRILVFTDKKQGSPYVPAMSLALTNEPITGPTGVTPTMTPKPSGDDIHDFKGNYDHDGDSATDVLEGTFDCVDPTVCSLSRSGTKNDGEHVAGKTKVTAISGYTFSGSGTTAAVDAKEDDSYLAFGVWLKDDGKETDITKRYHFAAFASGGSPVKSELKVVEGTATYVGSAAGVHSTVSRVDYFEGDAELKADFDKDQITGKIHNIVAGGESVPDNIYLDVDDLDVAENDGTNIEKGVFDGRTRMGAGTLGADGEQDYPFNGTWEGNFYNPMTAKNDDGVKMEVAPDSVAGTFGVTMDDDIKTTKVDETESYVGAFGAHKN